MPVRKELAILFAVLLAGLATTGCSPGRGIEAALVLGDVAAGDGASLYKHLKDEPLRVPVSYVVEGRSRRGDLYRPGDGASAAALVLVPGVAPAGRDDRRLVAFARTLARAGFLVLVPDIGNLRRLKVSPEDAIDIADAVRHLATRVPPADGGSVGLVGISYAAGPALIAASGDAGRDLRFLLAVGGYYDMTALVTYLITGFYRSAPDAPWQRGHPNEYGKWLFLDNNAALVPDPRDRMLLSAMAARKRRDPAAGIGDLVAALGPEGRSVHALLDNRDPERVPALIAMMPETVRRRMAALDPSRRSLATLGPRLILIHGRDDPVIPWTESAMLAAAAPPGKAALFFADSLAHVDLGPSSPGDALELWRAVCRLLAERDAMPAPAVTAAGSGAGG
jgi:poly(3-hydroxybutyrate) depolymerase